MQETIRELDGERPDQNDPNYKICQDAKRRLQETTDAKGRKFEVVELPLEAELSHMNFYIANDCVLVPITGQTDQGERPLDILREVFDDYDVVGIDSTILGEGGGGIHYITRKYQRWRQCGSS